MKKKYVSIITATCLGICYIMTGCGKDDTATLEKKKIEVSEESEPIKTETTLQETTTQETTIQETTLPETQIQTTLLQETTIQPTTTTQETTTEQQSFDIGIKAQLVRKHYAGDDLTAADFRVDVTKENGEVLKNPKGWTATPLHLVEGENNITICYESYSTVLTLNVEKRPEWLETIMAGIAPEAYVLEGASVLGETPDMGQEYLDKIVFLGDSRTYSYKAYGVLSGGKNTTQVWTPQNGTMTLSSQSYISIYNPDTGTDMPIRDAVALKKPEYMVIGLGTNGISYMSEETFKKEFSSLIHDIQQISPDTKIMINSIYPVARHYAKLESINNQKILEANKWLVQIAEETGVKYLNTAEVLVDEQGWLNNGYDNGGGSHLNKPGNELVMQYIRTHGYQ